MMIKVSFYNGIEGNKLGSFSAIGSFEQEKEETLGLLAYDNGIDESDILVKTEYEFREE